MNLPKLPHYLFCLFIGILLFSCKKDNSQALLLDKAQSNLAENRLDIAMSLLDSIQNPETMDKDSYMRYLVISMGIKYEMGEEIKGDTLIFEAKRYFNKKGNLEETVLANFYAAQLYDVNSDYPEALQAYMQTICNAQKSNNNLVAGKSYNNIGYIYFKKNLLDSAIVNYQKALMCYDKVGEDINKLEIMALINIGRAYEGSSKLDSAYLYFNKGLTLTKQSSDKIQESELCQNLAVTCYGLEEYDKAVSYFQEALNSDTSITNERRAQINMYLLQIYNKKQDSKSAEQYANLVVTNIPEVTNNQTTKEMYAALAQYYQQAGDYKKALEYSELEKTTKEKICVEANVPALLEADKNFYLMQKEKQTQEDRSQTIIYGIVFLVIFVFIVLFALCAYKENKRSKEEVRLQIEKYNQLRKRLIENRGDYDRIEAQIKSLLED